MAEYRCALDEVVVDGTATTSVHVEDSAGGIRAAIVPARGAELSSLQVRHGDRWLELLHRALDFSPTDDWQGRAPLLWPAVGRNFTAEQRAEIIRTGDEPLVGSWEHEGVVRPIPRHGFARELAWELVEADADSARARVVCRLRHDAFTREMYPFDFDFTLTCEVADGVLSIAHEVASHTDGLPFSIGNHLTLAVPFGAEGSMADCTFATPATQQLTIDALSLLDGGSLPVDAADGVPLSDTRWHNTVLGGFPPGEYWAEVRDPRTFGLRVSQALDPADKVPTEWMLFVLYGNPDGSYHCPEPWVGGPDSLNAKEGVVTLQAGERCTWTMTIQLV